MSSNPFKKWVTEVNGRWRGERFGVPPTSFSAPIAARLECMLTAGSRPWERELSARIPWAVGIVRRSTSHWGNLPFLPLLFSVVNGVYRDRPLSSSIPLEARATLQLVPSQTAFSTMLPEQGRPPLSGACRTRRTRRLMPVPHLTLHSPQSSHWSASMQSTAAQQPHRNTMITDQITAAYRVSHPGRTSCYIIISTHADYVGWHE